MKCYKLTDQNHKTRDNTQWGHGVTHTVLGNNTSLCSSSWLHFYTNPLIAVLVNPIHADIRNPVLWEAESSGEELHQKLKSGSKTLTTTRIIELPIITTTFCSLPSRGGVIGSRFMNCRKGRRPQKAGLSKT